MKCIVIQCNNNTIHSVPLVLSVEWPILAVYMQLLSSESVSSSARFIKNLSMVSPT